MLERLASTLIVAQLVAFCAQSLALRRPRIGESAYAYAIAVPNILAGHLPNS